MICIILLFVFMSTHHQYLYCYVEISLSSLQPENLRRIPSETFDTPIFAWWAKFPLIPTIPLIGVLLPDSQSHFQIPFWYPRKLNPWIFVPKSKFSIIFHNSVMIFHGLILHFLVKMSHDFLAITMLWSYSLFSFS